MEIRRVTENDGLDDFVALLRAVDAEATDTAAGYVDWERQAHAAEWLLAREDGRDVAAASLVVGWHTPPDLVRADIKVAPAERGRGVGGAVLAEVARRAVAHGAARLLGKVREDDGPSLAWAERRGFVETGRESRLVLDLASLPHAPEVAPPDGVEIVTWAERPELARALYDVYVEAEPDIPGSDAGHVSPFEEWLENDMSGIGDRPEATFVALAGDEVVGYAKFSLSPGQTVVAYHDLTGVKRSWRGRGVAGALKRAQIAWAKRNGFQRLSTANEVRNEPIRRLNERHGYRVEPGVVVVEGPVPR